MPATQETSTVLSPDPVGSIVRWLAIREVSGQPLPATYRQMIDDVEHSALLHRLLSGRDPHGAAPPRSYGQPWYGLLESGSASGCDLKPLKDRHGALPRVAINECPWRVLRQLDGGACVVQYSSRTPRFLARPSRPPSTGWRLRRLDPWPGRDPLPLQG
ncbi:MAG TPA: hypothetical protein VGL20_13050 [Candidatus Dormibacteraeota bacterium]